MKKSELIAEFAESCGINRAMANEYFDKLIKIVTSNLQAGRHVKLEKLGTRGPRSLQKDQHHHCCPQ